MYTDPWDLKHSIQQLQEEQKQQQQLISNQKYSSSTFNEDNSQQGDMKTNDLELSENRSDNQLHKDQSTQEKISNSKETIEKSMESSLQPQNIKRYRQDKKILQNRKKYGNLIVFFETSSTILSIGPNYVFFSIAYLCFTLSSIYLVYLVNTSLESTNFKVFNFAFCALQNISYLLIAFSNPGVVLHEPFDQQKRQKICSKCGAVQLRKTFHCKVCDVCIKDYDHHCPWSSKCIAEGNMKRFYFFVCMAPFYIFYYVVAFMVCMASLTLPHAVS